MSIASLAVSALELCTNRPAASLLGLCLSAIAVVFFDLQYAVYLLFAEY